MLNGTKTLALAAVFAGAILSQGCAHSEPTTEQNLDSKVSQETAVTTRSGLSTEAQQSIDQSKTLTPAQKDKLTALHQRVRKQLDDLREQSIKLRAILIQDVVSPNYNAKEVGSIKKRLKKLEDKRLSAIFDAIDRTNVILGRSPSKRDRQTDDDMLYYEVLFH